jgi:hypothetical protein
VNKKNRKRKTEKRSICEEHGDQPAGRLGRNVTKEYKETLMELLRKYEEKNKPHK